MTEKKSKYTGFVPAVDQSSRVLLCLARSPSFKLNLTDICRLVGIHKSKGYSILNTLLKYGFVHKDPEGKTYSLGLGLIAMSRRVLDNLNHVEMAGPILEPLARRTHSTALFGTIDDRNMFVVAKQEAGQAIGVTTRIGHRFNITHGAHGKAIVAFLPEGERKRILHHEKLFFHGPVNKYDAARLEEEVAACRKTGYAVDMGDLNPGINVVASPVFDRQGELIGAVFIMGTFQESLLGEYGTAVAETAQQFSARLGADVTRVYERYKEM